MSVFRAPNVITALSADGDSHGVATFASITGFQLGAKCYLRDTNGVSMVVKIVAIDATAKKLTLRKVEDGDSRLAPNYGATDISSFTLVNSSTLFQSSQDVIIDDIPQINVVTAPTSLL